MLDDLRAAHASVDHQFLPTSNELPGVVGGLALYLQYGDKFLEAAQQGGVQAVTELVTAPEEDGEPEAVDPEKSDKDAAQAARRATSQQTRVVEHEPGGTSKGKGKG